MTKPLHLLAICHYPSDARPNHQVFVRALLRELVAQGAQVSVLAPESLWNLVKAQAGFQLAPRFEQRDGLPIYRPRYLSFSTLALPIGGRKRSWSISAYMEAAVREAQRLAGPFDLCLGHFLYPQGLAAAQVGQRLGIPSFVSLGESSFDRHDDVFDRVEIGQLLRRFAGVIANSPLLEDRCVQHYGLPEAKIRVFPNGVNAEHFYPRDRQWARQQCGLPPERPIVIFVGQWIERKGPWRVLDAIRSRPEIGAVFLGHGPQAPTGPQVLYHGAVPHEAVPVWLSAADVFVLPTVDEGCSNAILEAMACGLPVVSSDLPFNHAILDEQVAVLVDPHDRQALEQAITALLADPARGVAMSRAAQQRSQSFRLADRAQRILTYLQAVHGESLALAC